MMGLGLPELLIILFFVAVVVAVAVAVNRKPIRKRAMATVGGGEELEPYSGPLFLHIPVRRLIVLSIASCGLYEAYWIYKNWRFFKEREDLEIHPFWRGVFGLFFCHSLLRRIHDDAEARATVEPTFSPSKLATGFVVLMILANIIGRAPSAVASIIAFVMPSYLCLMPVQEYVNSVIEKRSPTDAYYPWSFGHFFCLAIGLVIWAITLGSLGGAH